MQVWATPEKIGYGFSWDNTIMVDDTPRKMRHAPGNAVIVPEFKTEKQRRDSTLELLRRYLGILLEQCEGDVREYAARVPFRGFLAHADALA